MQHACDELHITTDDGSKGFHGFAADFLKQVMAKERVDCVWIIGPAIMMKVTSECTRPAGIKTFVSLNPVMVDGTGMCGSCRYKSMVLQNLPVLMVRNLMPTRWTSTA